MTFRIDDRINEVRRNHLQRVLEKCFSGNKAALGRRLGYRDGSFVGQMLRRERPITEVTYASLVVLDEVKKQGLVFDTHSQELTLEPVSRKPVARDLAVAQVRKEQIANLIRDRFDGRNIDFALAIGKSPSQVGHWLSGVRNPNGDTCREVERSLELPTGWLDQQAQKIDADDPVSGPPKTWQPSLALALPVVLDAFARAPSRSKVRMALLALLEDDDPAYRDRLMKLLLPPT